MTLSIAGRPRELQAGGLLPEDLLARCAERAPGYDSNDQFCQEDFGELRTTNYLLAPVPREAGGAGLSLVEVCAEQRRLAYRAAPTALAMQAHLGWVGVAADLQRTGDPSLEWLLQETIAGKVFAAGHLEEGNDVPLLFSTTTAERVDGGYRFTGRKAFGSLAPVWDFLGIHGMDLADHGSPMIVHAFVARDAYGCRIEPTCDGVMGMRASGSDATVLEATFVPDDHVARIVPVGFEGIDAFVLGILAWTLLGQGNIYYGLARRIFDEVVDGIRRQTSLAITRGSMVHHAGIQNAIAAMAIALETVEPQLDQLAQEWSDCGQPGPCWVPRLVAAQSRAIEVASGVAEMATVAVGGPGVCPVPGLERLVRDARTEPVNLMNRFLAREIVAKSALGVDLDEQPRWG